MILTHSHDEIENCDKCSTGIGISLQHNVAKADIVIGRNMASSDSTERRLRLSQFLVQSQ